MWILELASVSGAGEAQRIAIDAGVDGGRGRVCVLCAALAAPFYFRGVRRPPVEVAKLLPRPRWRRRRCLVAANAPVIDLVPEKAVNRGETGAAAPKLPAQLPRVATIILNNPGFRGGVRRRRAWWTPGSRGLVGVADAAEWGYLQLGLGEEVLRGRPLTVELTGASAVVRVKYLLPWRSRAIYCRAPAALQ